MPVFNIGYGGDGPPAEKDARAGIPFHHLARARCGIGGMVAAGDGRLVKGTLRTPEGPDARARVVKTALRDGGGARAGGEALAAFVLGWCGGDQQEAQAS